MSDPTVLAPARESGHAAQRRAADPEVSAWVSANAGAGKTRVLTDRVTRLLLAGVAPERILCLTFTRAAAAEMETRLFDRLGRWATLPDGDLVWAIEDLVGYGITPDLLPKARRLFARALETPGGIKIQTIHAFCESLLKRFPLEAGIAPHFEVLDDRSRAEMLREAREAVIARLSRRAPEDARLGAAFDRLAAECQAADFAALMDGIAQTRARLERAVQHHGGIEVLIAALCTLLGVDPDMDETGILRRACADDALPLSELRKAVAVLTPGAKSDRERAERIRAFLDAPDRAAAFAEYRKAFLTEKGEPQKRLVTKGIATAEAMLLGVLEQEQARVLALDAACRAAAIAQASAAALRVGLAVLDAFAAAKARRAALDYDDLILRTRMLLTEQSAAAWVLFKLDGGLDHILIDEAQDTSPEQWEIIRALTEEFFAGDGAREGLRTVFAVGDEKQSIYGFQGADPAGFAAMREVFAARVQAAKRRWRPERLEMTYRSTPAVLAAVDRVFARAEARAGLSAAAEEIRHVAARLGQPGRVEIWPTVRAPETEEPDPWDAPLDHVRQDDPRALLAERIAGVIETWLRAGEILPARGRPVRPGDILILVRRRDAFVSQMVRQLKSRNIPVAGADRVVLTEQIAVMDLIALGRFVLLPEDDLTLATVLRSPLAGITEEELFALAHDRPGTLWAALRARAETEEAGSAVAAAHDLLRHCLARADYAAPYEFFAEVLGPLGGRRRLVARLGPEAHDPIDEFLNLALQFERLNPPLLEHFLHWIEASRAEIKRDHEHGRDEVRIMTVHGAKGLEANIVFLADTCALPDSRFDPKILPAGPDGMLPLWPVRKSREEQVCATARARLREAQQAEYRRLLYVAMTRARDWLYVCGHESKRGLPESCWYDLLIKALKPEAREVMLPFGEIGWRIESLGERRAEEPAPAAAAPHHALPPPAWLKAEAPAEPRPSRPLAPSRLEGEEAPLRSPLGADGQARFRRGRLIHRLLQTLPDLPPAERAAAARRYLAQPAFGLDAAMVAEIAAETLRVIEDAAFAPLFGPGSQAEVPIAGHVPALGEDAVISGQVDRLLISADGVLVVDYKTNRPPPRRPEDVPALYLRQMAAYRAALKALYPDRPVRCALLWTDGPSLMPLPEAALDAVLAGRSAS